MRIATLDGAPHALRPCNNLQRSDPETTMKIPLKWLADYVPFDLSVAELAERLTLAGLEGSGFRSYDLPVP